MTEHSRPTRTVLVDAERRLAAAGVPSPRVDAELLLAHLLGIPRTRLVLSDSVDRTLLIRYESLLTKRAARQPLQHLMGTAPFRNLTLQVGPGVFVPRAETEIVAEAAMRELAASDSRVAVDLCAGSGALGLSLATEVPGTALTLVESDRYALEWLRRNVDGARDALLAAGSTAQVVAADVATVHQDALAGLTGQVDVVACNPPYVPDAAVPRDPEVRDHDPRVALYGGPDGLDVVREVAGCAAALLRPGGALVVEHGDAQGESAGELGVPHLLREHGDFVDVVDRVDLSRRDRYTVAHRA